MSHLIQTPRFPGTINSVKLKMKVTINEGTAKTRVEQFLLYLVSIFPDEGGACQN